jgi:hypothetical protein
VGTHVRLTRSGGLAGVSLVASVDLDDLPPAKAKQVKAALAEVDFDAPSAAAPHPGGADRYQYDLVVTDEGTRSLTAHDPFVGPGVRAVLDVLLPLAEPE